MINIHCNLRYNATLTGRWLSCLKTVGFLLISFKYFVSALSGINPSVWLFACCAHYRYSPPQSISRIWWALPRLFWRSLACAKNEFGLEFFPPTSSDAPWDTVVFHSVQAAAASAPHGEFPAVHPDQWFLKHRCSTVTTRTARIHAQKGSSSGLQSTQGAAVLLGYLFPECTQIS